ncbi:MAG: acyl-CoA dehydrogenase family protein [Solirubrobacteraceae bacterium]
MGGATEPDGGATEPVGGATEPDGGATEPDGGATESDGGAIEPDGGAIEPDGAATEPDGGEAAYRQRVRALIAQRAPRLPRRAGFRSPDSAEEDLALRRWRAELYAAGLLGADWPVEWGGRGEESDPWNELFLAEELARADLPPFTDQTHLAAFAVLMFGSEEQKRDHLPAIRDGREVWCQLFSEPDAGSDLASMRTRARRDGDEYVIDGQKVWSSNAEWSDFGFLLARTGPPESAHAGISAFVLPMDTTGVQLRPIREITGSTDFSEVFLDGARVPADAVLGGEGDGWRVAMESLGSERSSIGAGAARLRDMLEELAGLAAEQRARGALPVGEEALRQDIGRLASEVEVCNLLVRARLERESRHERRPQDIPIGKLAFSELNLEMVEYGLALQGARGLLVGGDVDTAQRGYWQDEFLFARTFTVAGGASELMRDLLAERALGMPRDRVRRVSSRRA